MKYAISHRDNPKEYKRVESYERRQRNPIGYLLAQAKYRAKVRGIPFDVTLADIDVPTHCPVFGFELQLCRGRRQDCSYSIDRWDNSLGYVKGNVRVISWKANQYKGNMSIADVQSLLKYMQGNQ